MGCNHDVIYVISNNNIYIVCKINSRKVTVINVYCSGCTFSAVGWVAGRASSLLKLSGGVLAWLSV